ncbi:hypothetical protein CANCADRAFT_4632 [Tortispora caseinolytica NRRL Y-17796]|uniref:Uncharacterized protein n=1 Tax=Tortispora caseinolytica NRRL Y-17796 TaxID=767744 RepID=A0A1E4T973_9ASCO|nr:hypothetical protein CANCADRAFT_4632 [Tortispora caseinolytica NRRL Y-17796]
MTTGRINQITIIVRGPEGPRNVSFLTPQISAARQRKPSHPVALLKEEVPDPESRPKDGYPRRPQDPSLPGQKLPGLQVFPINPPQPPAGLATRAGDRRRIPMASQTRPLPASSLPAPSSEEDSSFCSPSAFRFGTIRPLFWPITP